MRHKDWSYIKSTIRIIGYILIPINISVAAGALVGSEIVGIIEEIGEAR